MQLGPYQLISVIGTGGMGEVWKAEDTQLLREVAVKVLPANLAAADPEWRARFLREARTAARLSHPGIATIYSVAEEGSVMYIAMELIRGKPLSRLIASRLSPSVLIRISREVALALAFAHENGVIHRDIKPENIIVSRRGVKVLDFGIAKDTALPADMSQTKGNVIVGTPHYMSPEQALGRTVDHRTDIFSLGIVIYEGLSGHLPFNGTTVTETLMRVISASPEPLHGLVPGAPGELIAIVEKCLQKDPASRYQSMNELAKALAGIHLPTMPVPKLSEAERISAAPENVHDAETVALDGPRRRALVADDDRSTRLTITRALEAEGFAVDQAENGADAVRLIKEHEYSIFLLDILMPRLDGWSVLDFIRTRPNVRPKRICIVTGVRDLTLSAADREIVSQVLSKPLDPGRLVEYIRAASQSSPSLQKIGA